MSKSIMQDSKECYITHRTEGLHKHHIFYGTADRKKSEKYGCWVWLVPELHNASNSGVHFNKALDNELKQDCQKRFEEIYGHEKFMEIFGRNWL